MALVLGQEPAHASGAPRVHDSGKFLQFTTGLGYYSASGPGDSSFSGTTMNFGFMLGGNLRPGLVIGGGFWLDRAGSPKYEVGGNDSGLDFTQYVIGLGAFADYYLKPEGGWHVQGFLGWGGLETVTSGGGAGGSDPTGLVITIGGGHDWWISDAWAVGVMGRIGYGKFSLAGGDYPTLAPAVLGTMTWH